MNSVMDSVQAQLLGPLGQIRLACGSAVLGDPEKGDPEHGIAPGTPFESLPDDWCCPLCGVTKSMFQPCIDNYN